MPALWKRWQSISLETLSLKDITNELDFLKKRAIMQWKIRKKNLQSFANKLTEKMLDPRNAKDHCKSFIRKKPHKIGKTIKNNYSATKNF